VIAEPVAERYEGDSTLGRWWWRFNKLQDEINERELVVVFLVLVSLITASLAACVDMVVFYLAAGRNYLVSAVGNFWGGYAVYVAHTMIFVSLALYFTHTIAPNAAGSGLPEMKCILSGLTLAKYLSRKTLVAKVLGVTCALGSGMIVGRQGPFVHVSSCIVNLLSYARCFRNFASNQGLRMQLLAAACAIGVSVAYGAPIGGVLYSIEVTSTYYPIRYYWAAFISSIVSGFAFRAFWNLFLGQSYLLPVVPTNFSLGNLYMEWYEWGIVILMSVLGSVLGVAFIKLNAWTVSFRRQYAKQFPTLGPFHFTLLVGGLTAILFYPSLFGTYMGLGNMAAVKDLFADRTLVAYGNLNGDWTPYSVFLSIFLFFTVRFALGVFSASVAIPIGSYAPSLALGAALGRFFGEIVHVLWPTASISPAVYAVIGCCAFAGAITQTISTAVILLEITGDLNFICPALVAIMISVGISKKVSVNIYDSMLIIRRLPFLPDLKRRSYSQLAKDFMRSDVPALALNTSLQEMKVLLERYVDRGQNFRNINIPIVEDNHRGLFIGSTRFETFYSLYNQLKTEIKSEKSEMARLMHHTSEDDDMPVLEAIRFDLRPRLKTILYGNPIQCVPDTPIATVHIMFATLHLMNIFVVKNGRLMGVITRSALKKALKG
jgi:chloride channel 2